MGGRELEKQTREFRYLISDCALRDLVFQGPMFIWCNGREGHNCISERLIRFLANSLWIDCFFQAIFSHGFVANYNHLPIWLELEGGVIQGQDSKFFILKTCGLRKKAVSKL